MAGTLDVEHFPDEDPHTILFHLVEGVPPAPDDRVFAQEISDDLGLVNRIIRQLNPHQARAGGEYDYARSPEFRNCYSSFLSAARVGVERPHADLETGRAGLQSARRAFIHDFGRRLRNKYLGYLGICACVEFVIGVLAITLSILITNWLAAEQADSVAPYLRAGGAALIGNALAIWLTAAIYLQNLAWDKLRYIDPDGFPPMIRIAMVFVITAILMVLLDQQVLVLGLGNIMLNKFQSSTGISVLIGLLCGLSEVRVTGIIQGVFSRPVEPAHPAPARG